jgi:hypothetical protein
MEKNQTKLPALHQQSFWESWDLFDSLTGSDESLSVAPPRVATTHDELKVASHNTTKDNSEKNENSLYSKWGSEYWFRIPTVWFMDSHLFEFLFDFLTIFNRCGLLSQVFWVWYLNSYCNLKAVKIIEFVTPKQWKNKKAFKILTKFLSLRYWICPVGGWN